MVALAERLRASGAVVAVSEGEALAELPDWHAVDLTDAHGVAQRTFAKNRREVLMLSNPPAALPPAQLGLFA